MISYEVLSRRQTKCIYNHVILERNIKDFVTTWNRSTLFAQFQNNETFSHVTVKMFLYAVESLDFVRAQFSWVLVSHEIHN